MKCDRCGEDAASTIGSMFNTEMICMTCQTLEKAHPEYEAARDAEARAVKAGDFNFPGIGLPIDLKPKPKQVRCPECGGSVHRCKTGAKGCLHCDDEECGWLGFLS